MNVQSRNGRRWHGSHSWSVLLLSWRGHRGQCAAERKQGTRRSDATGTEWPGSSRSCRDGRNDTVEVQQSHWIDLILLRNSICLFIVKSVTVDPPQVSMTLHPPTRPSPGAAAALSFLCSHLPSACSTAYPSLLPFQHSASIRPVHLVPPASL